MTEQMAIEVLKEIVDEITEENGICYVTDCDKEPLEIAIQALEENQQCRAIGTVEELQALKEKSVAMKVEVLTEEFSLFGYDAEFDIYYCPSCSARMGAYDEQEKPEQQYCEYCGQHLDWE